MNAQTPSLTPPSPSTPPPMARPATLQRFIDVLDATVAGSPDEATLLPQVQSAMRALVAQDDWLDPDCARPHFDRYQQYPLYVDPQDRYSVVSFVWGPGQSTPVHNHTVWGVIGMLRGSECTQDFMIDDTGVPRARGPEQVIRPGDVACVSPRIGDVHQVRNAHADRASISIHVYGGNIGAIRRHVFPVTGGAPKAFVSGYSVPGLATRSYAQVRERLLRREEIALLDVREEAPHAEGHPLFAANLPLARLELEAWTRLPRLDVPIVTLDGGEGLAQEAAHRLRAMGYRDVAWLPGGVQGWKAAGGELFIDVNVPSKAFGELMESVCHTPTLPAPEVKALIDAGTDMVVLDVRRFDEYQTMSIPTGVSVPGAELVLRIQDLAPRPETQIIINCAGRTRGLLGTQALINAGVRNPVAALRNGTIGWTLAHQKLDTGQSRSYPPASPQAEALARERARAVADRAGVRRADLTAVKIWQRQEGRTTYFFDVRSADEYMAGHLDGFNSAPGGQLVQETEMNAPVRGARIVLVDGDGVRANMTASWLAQMAWEVHVLDGVEAREFCISGPWSARRPAPPVLPTLTPQDMQTLLSADGTVVLDLARHAQYLRGHIPGAWFVQRSDLPGSLARLPRAKRYVVTCPDGHLSPYAAAELLRCLDIVRAPHDDVAEVSILQGGTAAWRTAGLPLAQDEIHLATVPTDRYHRPYEGTDVSPAAMQAYLDWEFQLVEQLGRDGTHFFRPLAP